MYGNFSVFTMLTHASAISGRLVGSSVDLGWALFILRVASYVCLLDWDSRSNRENLAFLLCTSSPSGLVWACPHGKGRGTKEQVEML